MQKIGNIFAIIGICVLTFGCSKIPEGKLFEAKKLISEAAHAEAGKYAAEEITAAQASLNNAQTTIRLEKGKPPFMRNYEKAIRDLDSAIINAKKALQKAADEKSAIRAEEDARVAAEKMPRLKRKAR